MVDVDSNKSEEKKVEVDLQWKAFQAFDHDGVGTMKTSDLKFALQFAQVEVNEADCYTLISDFDPDSQGTIQYSQFKQIIKQINSELLESNDDELLDAFVAMGGEPDGEGSIDATTLIKTIKQDFMMTIDIESLIMQIDEDGSGEIEFDEFK